jgi:nucleoside-diphosphate-sugar epimerase
MKVFVTGATGAIGRFAVPALVRAGHDVTALARDDAKAARLARDGAVASMVSLFDATALAAAFAGHDAVANLATAIPPMTGAIRPGAWAMNNRIRTEGSTAVVDAALAAGVGRLVQESITFPYPDRGAEWIDESVPIAPSTLTKSVEVAEANAARFTAAGGTGVVLRFGLFYGPGSDHAEQFVKAARRRVGPVVGRPDAYQSSIHLADAASAVVAALDAPAGTYNVVDDEPLTNRDYARAIGAAVGRRPWIRFPGRLARLGGAQASTLTASQRVRNTRFKEATGWQPRYRSARDGWPAVVEAMESGASVHA